MNLARIRMYSFNLLELENTDSCCILYSHAHIPEEVAPKDIINAPVVLLYLGNFTELWVNTCYV